MKQVKPELELHMILCNGKHYINEENASIIYLFVFI